MLATLDGTLISYKPVTFLKAHCPILFSPYSSLVFIHPTINSSLLVFITALQLFLLSKTLLLTATCIFFILEQPEKASVAMVLTFSGIYMFSRLSQL